MYEGFGSGPVDVLGLPGGHPVIVQKSPGRGQVAAAEPSGVAFAPLKIGGGTSPPICELTVHAGKTAGMILWTWTLMYRVSKPQ